MAFESFLSIFINCLNSYLKSVSEKSELLFAQIAQRNIKIRYATPHFYLHVLIIVDEQIVIFFIRFQIGFEI